MTIRFPDGFRAEMQRRVDAGETSSESELVRLAVAEYFEHHPVS